MASQAYIITGKDCNCSNCGKLVQATAKVCWNCKISFVATITPEQLAAQQVQASQYQIPNQPPISSQSYMIVTGKEYSCSNCGKLVQASAKACWSCKVPFVATITREQLVAQQAQAVQYQIPTQSAAAPFASSGLPTVPLTPPDTKKTKWRNVALGGAGFAVVLCIGCGALGSIGNSAKQVTTMDTPAPVAQQVVQVVSDEKANSQTAVATVAVPTVSSDTTATPAPTATVAPTHTPIPTPTTAPTDTPAPTATATLPPAKATAQAKVEAKATTTALEANYESIDVRALAKSPDRFKDQKIKLTGEVFTIHEGEGGFLGLEGTVTRMQIWVQKPGGNEFDREAVFVEFNGTLEEVYEGSMVIVYGTGAGTFTGTNAMGAEISQPAIAAQWVRWSTSQ